MCLRSLSRLVRTPRYYDYTLSVNGKAEHHGNNYYMDYLTDLIANRTVKFISEHATVNTSSTVAAPKPFFAMLGTPSCHIPDDYAPWTAGMFVNASAPRTDNWNHAPNPDKHWMMRYIQPMDGGRFDGGTVNESDWVAVKRWRTLQVRLLIYPPSRARMSTVALSLLRSHCLSARAVLPCNFFVASQWTIWLNVWWTRWTPEACSTTPTSSTGSCGDH